MFEVCSLVYRQARREKKGCSALAGKKYYRPPGAVEIFSGKCHRISRPGVFINSERTDFEPRL